MTEYRSYGTPRITDVRQRLLMRCVPQDRGHATKCLIWMGEKDKDGYGRIKRDGKYVQAHWVLDGDPPKGLEKDHLCHQRDCVRPSHLKDVTRAVNTQTRLTSGDSGRKMSYEERMLIQETLQQGVSAAEVARVTGFSRRTIGRIKNGEQE